MNYISPSQVEKYLLCPLKYFFYYKCGITPKISSAIVIGKAVHSGIENLLKNRSKVKSASMDHEFIDQSFEAAMSEIEQSSKLIDDYESIDKESIKNYIKLFSKEIKVVPSKIEHKIHINVNLGDRGSVAIISYADYIEEHEDGCIIRDIKVYSRPKTLSFLMSSQQMNIMASAYSTYAKVKGIALDQIIKAKEPYIKSIYIGKFIKSSIHLAVYVYLEIQRNIFYPRYGDHCSWCEYNSICVGCEWHNYIKDISVAREAARMAGLDIRQIATKLQLPDKEA